MSRETDAQSGMLEAQLAHDSKARVVERLHDLISQGAKGLVILNGGAAVAVLAFVQALVERSIYFNFKPYAVGALVCFLIGAFLGAIVFFFQHSYVMHGYNGTGKETLWYRVSWGLLIGAASAAFIGGALIAVGIWCAV